MSGQCSKSSFIVEECCTQLTQVDLRWGNMVERRHSTFQGLLAKPKKGGGLEMKILKLHRETTYQKPF